MADSDCNDDEKGIIESLKDCISPDDESGVKQRQDS